MTSTDKVFIFGAGIVVLAAVLFGLAVLGSPQHQQGISRDELRIARLQQIAQNINERYQVDGKLPATVVNVAPTVDGKDPLTGRAFEYHRLDRSRYTLCATFESKSDERPAYGLWDHPAGRYCFRRRALETVF
ncbi:MAG: hypothetical protein JO060_02050 [Candidatus Eremiobacteraeota bacterium]|nr:hypothetical protein [Candidatus Eremiobacteraeota bacterium]MBV9646036.1 hypothetical protein [Candidatus Eremiobacteraeota bacterium]